MILGYAVVYDKSKLAAMPIGETKADGDAILRTFRLQYPNLGETARVVELHEKVVDDKW